MINSLGLNARDSFSEIIAGKCGVRNITCFDATNFPVQIAAEIADFVPESVIDPKEVKKMDRFIQLGFKAAIEAMDDSGLKGLSEQEHERFGISAASGIGGLSTIQKNSEINLEKGPKRISPFFIPSSLANMLGGFISIEHGLKGPNLASVTACAAGNHAIIEATKTIILNGADRMLVVAAEAAICAVGIGGFAAMKALSDRNSEPQRASRPFDKDRDGFVMGEGAAALVLEDYEIAKARGAKIYAELVGFGESGDANHYTAPAPEGEGGYRAMKAASKMANVKIDYVNCHGTSTPIGDMYETQALKNLFGGKENCPPVSSTKGATGHCLGAAGGVEAVISIMAMNSGIVPPTINYETPDENCDLDYVPNKAREMSLNAIMSNSFGFGGTNAVVIFKKV